MTPVVRSQRQDDADYFDLSNAFDLVPNNLLLHESSSFGFSDGYVSWFRSYVTNRQFRVRFSGTLSLPFQVTSSVPEISVLEPFLFNVFINDLCNSATVNFYFLLISEFSASWTLHMTVSYCSLTLIL
jgi:hypothetical protein